MLTVTVLATLCVVGAQTGSGLADEPDQQKDTDESDREAVIPKKAAHEAIFPNRAITQPRIAKVSNLISDGLPTHRSLAAAC